MLPRILEAEVMDTAADAADYDAMDFATVNAAFAVEALATFDAATVTVLDIGTGTARIPIAMAERAAAIRITAVDLSEEMLKIGRRNVAAAGLADRIELRRVDAKGMPLADGAFDAVVSNSIVHHIPEPRAFFREAIRLVKPGGRLFVRDLARPADRDTLDRLVATYAATDTPHQRQLFADSLHAALTLDEVRALVGEFGFPPATVTLTSDRHWTWAAESSAVARRA
jgi:ubiquinone/menaquinone biosynthesis C-methylase UbiE